MRQLPYVHGSETSKAAADSMEDVVNNIQSAVYEAVIAAGEHGITCDEVEDKLGLSHQTASARLAYLSRDGLIGVADTKRKSRTGRAVNVYVVSGKPLPERTNVKYLRKTIAAALEYAHTHLGHQRYADALAVVERIALRKP